MRPFLIVAALLLATSPARAADALDQSFVATVGSLSQFEITSGELGLVHSKNVKVQQLSYQLVEHYKQAAAELSALLQSTKSPMQVSMKLTPQQSADINEIKQAPAGAFDAVYLTIQTDAIENAQKHYNYYAKNGTDSSLRQFSTKMLQVSRNHAALAADAARDDDEPAKKSK